MQTIFLTTLLITFNVGSLIVRIFGAHFSKLNWIVIFSVLEFPELQYILRPKCLFIRWLENMPANILILLSLKDGV